jgi:hypothetical protein
MLGNLYLLFSLIFRPTKGLTKVNIFSYEFKGLNYTDFPTPKCQFGKHEPTGASWVHCYGWNKAEKGEKVRI